jgi:hypothetical protein
MWIRLTRKLADYLDGVDVSSRRQGDVFELPTLEAQLLIAEGWAAAHIPPVVVGQFGAEKSPTSESQTPSDSSRVIGNVDRLRRMREQMHRRHVAEQERRRVEDTIRQELHDAQAKTIEVRESTIQIRESATAGDAQDQPEPTPPPETLESD